MAGFKSILDWVILKLGYRSMMWGLRRLTRKGDIFLTYTQRPKYSCQIVDQAEPEMSADSTAIVMQGPIASLDDFTLETLRIYRRNMPGAHLILSTWNDTPEDELAPIRAEGVEVILTEKPKIPGVFNINMQLVSTEAGVRTAHTGGFEWIMKTRTDQRIYRPNVTGFLASISRAFPAAGGFSQKHRIIGVGEGSLKYAPYHVTDQTVFGHADDMLNYWTPGLRTGPLPNHWPEELPDIYTQIPIGELCRHGSAEVYITSTFLERIGRPLEWTLKDSWTAYRDCFCFVDYAATDFFWGKTKTVTFREDINRYDTIWTRNELTFADWMLLYAGQVDPTAAEKYEHALELRFMDGISMPEEKRPNAL